MMISGSTCIAGVVGRPVAHSLSPLLHNAWLQVAKINGAYVAFSPIEDRFGAFIEGLRGGVIRGVNVTVPFKEMALALSDRADAAAQASRAANLLLFHEDGTIEARNTDGIGLLAAFAEQAPLFHVKQGPVVILGAGGAAKGAAVAIQAAGCSDIRIVNRTLDKARELADKVGGRGFDLEETPRAFAGASAIINATSAGLADASVVHWPLESAPEEAVVMDMTYKPLETEFLRAARARGLQTVDGLAMLIGQARPSFEALFREPPSSSLDVRRLLLAALENAR